MNLGDCQFLIGFDLNILRNPPCHEIEKLHGRTGKLVLYLHKPHPYLIRTYYTVNSPALPQFPSPYRQFIPKLPAGALININKDRFFFDQTDVGKPNGMFRSPTVLPLCFISSGTSCYNRDNNPPQGKE